MLSGLTKSTAYVSNKKEVFTFELLSAGGGVASSPVAVNVKMNKAGCNHNHILLTIGSASLAFWAGHIFLPAQAFPHIKPSKLLSQPKFDTVAPFQQPNTANPQDMGYPCDPQQTMQGSIRLQPRTTRTTQAATCFKLPEYRRLDASWP